MLCDTTRSGRSAGVPESAPEAHKIGAVPHPHAAGGDAEAQEPVEERTLLDERQHEASNPASRTAGMRSDSCDSAPPPTSSPDPMNRIFALTLRGRIRSRAYPPVQRRLYTSRDVGTRGAGGSDATGGHGGGAIDRGEPRCGGGDRPRPAR